MNEPERSIAQAVEHLVRAAEILQSAVGWDDEEMDNARREILAAKERLDNAWREECRTVSKTR